MNTLLFLSFFFCAGVYAALCFSLPFAGLFPVSAAAILACWSLRRHERIGFALICLSALLAGAAVASVRSRPALSDINAYGPGMISVRGVVRKEPETRAGKTILTVDADEVARGDRAGKAGGRLMVVVKGAAGCGYGDRVLATGELLYGDWVFPPWRTNYAAYLANHGITRVLRCEQWQVSVIGSGAGGNLEPLLISLRRRFSRLLRARLSSQSAAVMQAMVLGDKKAVSPLIYKAMINSGTIHILVVSGFNVGIVAFVLLALLKLLRFGRKIRFFLLLPGIVFYCLLTGVSEPVSRAGIMAIVMAAAYLGRRDGDIQGAFAVALWLMLTSNPRLLFDAGFQLSYISVFALIVVYPKLREVLKVGRIRGRLLAAAADSFLVSLSAWLGTAGFVACYFGIIAPGSVLINLAAAPLAGFITLCGFSLVATEAAAPFCSRFIATTGDYAIGLLIHIVSLRFPFIMLS